MKTITRLKREPRLFAAIVNRLTAMTKDAPRTAADILADFEPNLATHSIMADAGYDHKRRESGVLILAALDDLVDMKAAVAGYDDAHGPVYHVCGS